MGAGDAWEPLLERSISAFYEGQVAEGRLACDQLLCLPDLPANVRDVTRTNQVHYAPQIHELAASVRESTISPAGVPESAGGAGRNPLDPDSAAFRDLRALLDRGNVRDQGCWLSVVINDMLYGIASLGPTVVVRCDLQTGALALEAFHDAPFVAQDFHGGAQLVETDDGYLAIVSDAVTWESGEQTVLHRFVRFDPTFRISALSHPFCLPESGVACADGLAREGDILTITYGGGQERLAASLALSEALALLQPVDRVSPAGGYAFPMPGWLLTALPRWTPPPVPDEEGRGLVPLPVLPPEAVIAAMQGEAHDPAILAAGALADAERVQGNAPAGDQGSRPYDAQFFEAIQAGSMSSARVVVPYVIGLVHPKSVVDLGCGTGEWLAAFQNHGITDVLGIDGDWVPMEQLHIPPDQFMPHDLCEPVRLERRFDLAVSLETGEHLPPDCAATLVSSLTALAPVVLFSAAAPGQGGTDHRNMRWPGYWAELFAAYGFVTIDCIRPLICTSPDVRPWYVQNTLLFVARSHLDHHEILRAQYEAHGGPPLPWIHQDYWLEPDSWAGELRRVRDAWKLDADVRLTSNHQLERLVDELRDERNAWKAQAERHEQAAKELRILLGNEAGPHG